MNVGVLGTGNVATAVGEGLAASGHRVVFGSRTPEAKAGRRPPVVGLRDAARHGEIVVNATSGRGSLQALERIGPEPLAGKILIDIAMHPDREPAYPDSSLAETIQAAFPGACVVKTLSSVPARLMANPRALGAPSTVFLSGDDSEAKRLVAGLLEDLGWPPESQLDLGGLATARGPEHLVPLLLDVYDALGTSAVNINIVR
jgi:hypothetical protein